MDTLKKYELGRRNNISPTSFSPAWLEEYEIERAMAKKSTASNKLIKKDLFDQIIFFKQMGETIHAIGLAGKTTTLLVMSKPKEKKKMEFITIKTNKELQELKTIFINHNQSYLLPNSISFPKFVAKIESEDMWGYIYTFNQQSKELTKEELISKISK
jgi:DNA-binding GntR family transcriptional regulator